MIFLLLGPPGSGKTYEAVKEFILVNVKARRQVVTNIPLILDTFTEEEREYLVVITETAENPTPFLKVRDWQTDWMGDDDTGPVLVLDEVHQFLARHNIDKEVLNHIALHRKFGQDLVLITQTISQLHPVVRDKVQTTFKFRKATAFGMMTRYSKQTIDGTRGQKLSITTHKYDKRVFPYYKSHMVGGVVERMAVQQKTFWSGWRFKVLAVVILIILYKAWTGGFNHRRWFAGGVEAEQARSAPVVTPGSSSSASAQESPSQASTSRSSPESAPAPVAAAPAMAPEEDFGPLGPRSLVIAGSITGSIKGESKTVYYLDMDGYQVEAGEISEMGYSLQVYGECGLRLTWKATGVSRYVTCRPLKRRFEGGMTPQRMLGGRWGRGSCNTPQEPLGWGTEMHRNAQWQLFNRSRSSIMIKFWERHSLASLAEGEEGDDQGRIFLASDGGRVQQADLTRFTVLMESVDTVRQLYRGKPSREWLERLEQLKEGSSTPILNAEVGGAAWGMLGADHWLGQPWAVRSMGKASGFQWCLQNNDLGFTILFKSFYATEDREGAHLKIECSPKAISRRTPDELQAVLDAMAAELLSEAKPSGVAVHLAVDFQGWNLGGNFLDRLKTRSRVVRDFSGITKLEFHDIATAATTYGRGESFLVGKPLGCQLAAYLKSKEIIHSDKEDYFHDCWREASAGEFDPKQEVWRVEFRFHQDVLRDLGHNQGEDWQSFSGLAYALGDIWRYGCGLHRLHTNDRLIDPYWQLLTQDCTFQNRVLGFFMCRKKKEGLGNSGKNVQLLVGNLVSLLARQGATAEQVLKNLKALECWREILRYYESIGRSESDIREAIKKGILVRRLTKQAA